MSRLLRIGSIGLLFILVATACAPVATPEPQATEAPAATEAPVATETPAPTEEPAVAEAPAPGEVQDVPRNRTLIS